jgi:hypothetical protein
MDTYTIVGGGGGGLPTTPHPLNTSSPLLHTTTHNNTQQHYTTALGDIKLPMYQLFLWRLYLYLSQFFWVQMAFASLVPFQGPKKSRFSGPTPSNATRNDVAPLKTITYRAIKTTGTLIIVKLY